jgi:glycine cleavage system regulatory protein
MARTAASMRCYYTGGGTPGDHEMHTYKLITLVADDRPGLVESLSEVVIAHGGNWLESRMSNLGGKFAGIVRIVLPSSRVPELEHALSGLQADGISLRMESAAAEGAAAPVIAWHLEIVGHDRPGIVHEFAAALARKRINVVDMRSDISSAPMSADPLFTASAEIHVPAGVDVEDLRDSLEALADELTIEYLLSPAK